MSSERDELVRLDEPELAAHLVDAGDVAAVCLDCNGNGLVIGWNKAYRSHTIQTCPSCGGTGQRA